MNNLLSQAWNKYAASLSNGDVLELEPEYETWVAKALDEAVRVTVDEAA